MIYFPLQSLENCENRYRLSSSAENPLRSRLPAMRLLLPFLVAAPFLTTAQQAATPYDYAPGPFPDSSLCVLHFQTSPPFGFDLRPLAAFFSANFGYNYTLNGCGTLPLPCTSSCAAPFSSAQQGAEQLAAGPPLHALADPANPATGGLISTFTDAWTPSSDGSKCGRWDPVVGRELGRSLVIRHACNATATIPFIAAVAEAPQCVYTYTLVSAAACGVPGGFPDRAPISPSAPAAPWPPAPGAGPFSPYLCSPVLTDGTGQAWSFPRVASLYNTTGDYFVKASVGAFAGALLSFQVCGLAHAQCTPADFSVGQNTGSLIATWAEGGVEGGGNAAACAFNNGTGTACTPPCRAVGGPAPPHFELLSSGNGNHGLSLAWQGGLANADEPSAYRCGYDGAGNPLRARSRLSLSCDATVEGLAVDSASADGGEGGCDFVITARAAAACGMLV